jgi:hypothetical protein
MTDGRVPPRHVPTLTDVVRRAPPQVGAGAVAGADAQARIVARVMQRIDADFDRRLREAIATLVAEQAQSLRPRLHAELEDRVREAVAQALAEARNG